MSPESTTMPRYDQYRAADSREPFAFDSVDSQPEEFLAHTTEVTFSEANAQAAVAEAEAVVREAFDAQSTIQEKLVFPDERGHFEIKPPTQRVEAAPSMLDDAWREQVQTRREAAAREAEARAEEIELTQSVGANATAIEATRDYVTKYGMNAG
jgi:hypothetical protein